MLIRSSEPLWMTNPTTFDDRDCFLQPCQQHVFSSFGSLPIFYLSAVWIYSFLIFRVISFPTTCLYTLAQFSIELLIFILLIANNFLHLWKLAHCLTGIFSQPVLHILPLLKVVWFLHSFLEYTQKYNCIKYTNVLYFVELNT